MSLRNYIAGLAIGASALAYSASVQAGVPPTPEQQRRAASAYEDMKLKHQYGKPTSEPASQNEVRSNSGLDGMDLFFPVSVLGFLLFTEKHMRRRK